MHARLIGALLLGLSIGMTGPASGHDWPTKTVRIVVPFGAGGTADVVARIAADHLSEVFKQPFIVENRPGAGGMIGVDAVSKGEADGYTLTLTNVTTMALIPTVNANTPYDPIKDFTHIAYLAGSPAVFAVSPHTGAKTLSEFVAYAKANGKPVTFGSAGVGSDGHIIGEAIGRALGFQVQHLPYRAVPAAVSDAIAGHIDFVTFTAPATSTLIKDGKLNGLAVTSPHRMSILPNVPTFDESGYRGLETLGWFALSGPAKMPRSVAEAVNRAIVAMVQKPDVRATFERLGVVGQTWSVDEFTAFVKNERDRWKPLIEAAGMVGAVK